MNRGFNAPLDKTHKVVDRAENGKDNGNLKPSKGKIMVGLRSNSKASIQPTSDSDDTNPRANGLKPTYGTANGGGASGDGRTPGYDGKGSGVNELDGAHGNNASRKLAYGN